MPIKVIKKFKDEYGVKQGEQIYYATENKQGSGPETFEKAGVTKAKKVTNAKNSKNPASKEPIGT